MFCVENRHTYPEQNEDDIQYHVLYTYIHVVYNILWSGYYIYL